IWDEFKSDPQSAIAGSKKYQGTDQAWVNTCLDVNTEATVSRADGIYDFRVDFLAAMQTKLPLDCRMVMWPGPRDPGDVNWRKDHEWIARYYCPEPVIDEKTSSLRTGTRRGRMRMGRHRI